MLHEHFDALRPSRISYRRLNLQNLQLETIEAQQWFLVTSWWVTGLQELGVF